MSQIKIAGLFCSFTDGHLLLVPAAQMPFPKSPEKVLHEFEADFYRASPHYARTVEVRVDADPGVLQALELNGRHRLVTILGSVNPSHPGASCNHGSSPRRSCRMGTSLTGRTRSISAGREARQRKTGAALKTHSYPSKLLWIQLTQIHFSRER